MQPGNNGFNNRYDQLDRGGVLEATPASVPVTPVPVTDPHAPHGPSTLLHFNRRALIITGAVTLLVIIAGLVTLGLAGFKANNQAGENASKQPANNYNVKDLSLNDTVSDQLLNVTQASKLSINGELQVGNTFVLSPTAIPTTPKVGQIYYDKTSNTPYIYNGTSFLSLIDSPAVQSIGGIGGALTLGNGLQITGSQLALTSAVQQSIGPKVTTLQGQSGDVSLLAGNGIAVNGTTITNTGVMQVTGDGSLSVTQSNGTVSLALPQLLGTANSPTFASVQLSSALGMAYGGTGLSTGSITPNSVMITSASGTSYELVPGTTGGQCLITDALDSNKIKFGSCTGGGGGGVTTVGTINSQTKNANGAVISGTNIYLQTADDTNPGLVSTTAQTFAGAKTFNAGIVIGAGQAVTGAGALTVAAANNANLTLATSGSGKLFLSGYDCSASGGGGKLTVLATGQVTCDADGDTDTTGITQITAGNGISISGANNVIAVNLQSGSGLQVSGSGLGLLNTCSSTQVLKYSGSAWACDDDAIGTGDGVGITTIGTLDAGTLSANGAYTNGTDLFLQSASALNPGLVNTTTQTFAGAKTFSAAATFSAAGTAVSITNNATIGGTLTTGAINGSGALTIAAGGSNQNLTLSKSGTGNIVLNGFNCASNQNGGALTVDASGNISCSDDDIGAGDGVGATTVGTIDSQTKSANGAVISGTTLYLQSADASNSGLVNTGTQTFAGGKTFNGAVTLAAAGTALSITNNATISGTLTVGALTGSGALTVAAGGSSVLTLQGGSGTGGVLIKQPTFANASSSNYTLPSSALNGELCIKYSDLSSNCSGLGGAVSTTGGTPGTIAVFTASNSVGDSILLQDTSGTGTLSIGAQDIVGNGLLIISAGGSGNKALVLRSHNSGDIDIDSGNDGNIFLGHYNGLNRGIVIGHENGASSVAIQAGTGGIFIGNTGVASPIQIGATHNWITQDINIGGNNVSFGAVTLLTLGSTSSTSATTIQAGSAGISLSGNVAITAGKTLNLGTASSDPTGTNGAMYYNTVTDIFRCYTAGVWANCSGSGVSVASGAGTSGKLVKFNGSGQLADSSLSEASTTLTYAGNAIVNAASGFTGNLLDLQLNGTSKLSVTEAGNTTIAGTLTVANIQAPSSTALLLTGNAASTLSTTAGNLTLQAGSGTISVGTTATISSTNGLTLSSGAALTLQSATTSAVTLDSGTTGTVNVGTGANSKTVNIGNSATSTAVNVQAGGGGFGVTAKESTFTSNATTQTGLQVNANSLTTGSGLKVATTSGAISSGNLLDVSQNSTYASTFSSSSKLLNVSRSITGPPAPGTVSFETSASAQVFTNSSLSWSHTVGSGSNRALVVGVSTYDGPVTQVTFTVGGVPQSLTKIGTVTNVWGGGSAQEETVWILKNPTTGAGTVAVTVSSAVSATFGISTSWTGVDQTTPNGTVASALNSSNTTSQTLSPIAASGSQLVVDFLAQDSANSGTPTQGGSQTLIAHQNRIHASRKLAATSMAWTWGGSDRSAMIAVPLNPATVAGTVDGTLTGSVANIASSCLGCTETASILNLQQSNTAATGAVLSLQNSGLGADILLGNGIIRATSDSTTALRIQNAAGTNSVFVVDTTNGKIGIGATPSSSGALLQVASVDAATVAAFTLGGVNASSVTVGNTTNTTSLALQGTAAATITLGTATQTGTITLGQSTASNTINIGNGTIAAGNTGTINIGTSSTSTGKTAITIGSTNGASSLLLQGGTGNIIATAAFNGQSGLYTGSGSGTLRVSSAGALSNISIPTGSTVTVGSAGAYGVPYVDSSNVLQFANVSGTNSYTKCLLSNGSTAIGFGTCPAGSGGWSLTGSDAAGSILGSNTTTTANFVISSRPNNVSATATNASYISFSGDGSSNPNRIVISGNSNSNAPQGGGAWSSSNTKDYFRIQDSSGDTAFAVQGNGTGQQVFMYLASGSSVGVNSRVCSTLAAGGSGMATMATCTNVGTDLAEAYRSTQSLVPGEIVAIDHNNYPNVIRSSQAGQADIIGIVSTDPNETMGTQTITDGYPIALNGRVPTKVNGEGGVIHPGDKITSSSVAGVGKKATGAGMIVGVALTGFDGSGQGSIEVFVSPGYYEPSGTDTLQAQSATFGTATVDNLTVTGLASVHNLLISGHIITASGQPTNELQAAAGSGATVTIDGNDTLGTISITTGSAPTAGEMAKLIFSELYTASPRVVLSPSNDNAAGMRYFKGTTTTSGFMLNFKDAPAANTTYTFDYFIGQ